MNASGDAAEQIVRMSLQGVEFVGKMSLNGAEKLIKIILSELKAPKRTKGRASLTTMLKSNKPIKVFELKDEDLKKFCQEAKKYGVMYHVLKDRDKNDGKCDIMVRAEDSSKVNRIFQRFNLGANNKATIRATLDKSRDNIKQPKEKQKPEKSAEDLFLDAVKTTSNENPLEVVTLNDEKIDLLREIMKDMNTMTGAIIPRVVAETTITTDEDGHSIKTTTYVTKKVLVVTIAQLNTNQIADVYRMNDEQKAQINELLSPEYDALWNDLIGSNGMIINPNTSYVGTGIFAWPLDGDYTITSPFGTRVDPISGIVKTHGGTDIAAPTGTPLLAAADGVVVTASYQDNGYGFYVKIKHDNTYSTLYGHCSVLHVTAGQTVKQGQMIAEVGSTGYSTGPHVHYEIIQNGVRVDAMWFYKK